MTPAALRQKLTDLIATWENEVVEFKEASNSYSTGDIGKYFSALSNEANLKDVDAGWLVFGVNNKSRTVVGTDYRPAPEHLQSLKQQIAEGGWQAGCHAGNPARPKGYSHCVAGSDLCAGGGKPERAWLCEAR